MNKLQKLVNYALLNDNGHYFTVDHANVFTENHVIIVDFDTEQQRSDYIVDNDIEVEMEDFAISKTLLVNIE